jgi:hypothetical protein
MKARILTPTHLYQEAGDKTTRLLTLQPDEIVELGDAIKVNDDEWVPATRQGEELGFIAGDSQVFVIKRARIRGQQADLVSEPNRAGAIVDVLAKGHSLEITDVLEGDGGRWVRVLDDAGQEGYLPGTTRIEIIQERPQADPVAELRGWGMGLLIMGVVSIFLSSYLNPTWGSVMVGAGISCLLVQRRFMFLVVGGALIVAGIVNMITRGVSGWALFGLVQIVLGFGELRKYWLYTEMR